MPDDPLTADLGRPIPAVAEDHDEPPPSTGPALTVDQVRTAFSVIDLGFDEEAAEMTASSVTWHRDALARLRSEPMPIDLVPASRFEPRLPGLTAAARRSARASTAANVALPAVERPADLELLAFASIAELASLIHSRQVSCVELTELAIARLRRLDPRLHFVVTMLEGRAHARAETLDAELADGQWRGPLHGIPWGAKDLLAVARAPTTWGTPWFAEQSFDFDATVVQRLDAAGAVLVAKLSLGELAWGDVWTGGQTVNPWDLSEGASGSSAGSASAVAAGAVPFSIGSETLGSILSPSSRCGCTGLRPTFGRVSRHGAMTLAWSMDKLGPIARSAEDASIVFAAIHGPDGLDESVVERPFAHPEAADLRGWRVGVVEASFDAEPAQRGALDALADLGVDLVPFDLPTTLRDDYWTIIDSEAAASFDEFTRAGGLRRMIRDGDETWPNTFRAARLIPAVDYLRADRLRRRLIHEMDAALRAANVDLTVHPSDEERTLRAENLTGHPAISIPWGRRANGAPDALAFTGLLDREADLVAFAMGVQAATDHHRRHPET